MKAKRFPTLAVVRTRRWFPRCMGRIDHVDRQWVQNDSISRLEFIDWCTDNQNRATVGTYIFAVQTFGLVVANSADFSILELVNLNIGKAVKSCRSPGCGLLCEMMTMFIVPLCAGIAIYIGMYVLATKLGNRGLPLRWHHLQRGYIQLYLFSFAPITRHCAEMLMCRTLSQDGSTTVRLVTDLSRVCWEGTHLTAALIAVSVLLVYMVVLPAYLLRRTSTYMRERDKTAAAVQNQSEDLGPASLYNPRTFLSSRARGRKLEDLDEATLLRVKSTPTLNPKCKSAMSHCKQLDLLPLLALLILVRIRCVSNRLG